MKKNVGFFDSIIRIIIGGLIMAAGVVFESLWGLVGIIPVMSGAVSWCPLYKAFGIYTCDPNLEREN